MLKYRLPRTEVDGNRKDAGKGRDKRKGSQVEESGCDTDKVKEEAEKGEVAEGEKK